MEKYENFTQPLTDEELMELAGGFSSSTKSFFPITLVAYGAGLYIAGSTIKGAAAAYKA